MITRTPVNTAIDQRFAGAAPPGGKANFDFYHGRAPWAVLRMIAPRTAGGVSASRVLRLEGDRALQALREVAGSRAWRQLP